MMTYRALRDNKDLLFGEGSEINILKDSCMEIRQFKNEEGNWSENCELCVCKVQIVKGDGSEVDVEVMPFKIQIPSDEALQLANPQEES